MHVVAWADEGFDKQCRQCQQKLELGQLRWGTGLCDTCYDVRKQEASKRDAVGAMRQSLGVDVQAGPPTTTSTASLHHLPHHPLCIPKPAPITSTITSTITSITTTSITASTTTTSVTASTTTTSVTASTTTTSIGSAGAQTVISAQLVFYLAPAMLLPSLYLQIEATGWDAPDHTYAAVLTTTTVVSMVSPVPLGMWAERSVRCVPSARTFAGPPSLPIAAADLPRPRHQVWRAPRVRRRDADGDARRHRARVSAAAPSNRRPAPQPKEAHQTIRSHPAAPAPSLCHAHARAHLHLRGHVHAHARAHLDTDAHGPVVFALSWASLSAPISLRGVRAAYFAKYVPPEELSRCGQLASAAGLVRPSPPPPLLRRTSAAPPLHLRCASAAPHCTCKCLSTAPPL